ncbi:MAG TPA: LysM peptidoglycan-binding domain-containing protein [Longimicrobiales bacterium]|nr:LysM peptidoglycan-binding domain-containing protein [Longimicrobiales bacterium]
MRGRSWYGAMAAVLAMGVATAYVVEAPPETERAPVDVLLEKTADADLPEASVGSTMFAAAPLRTRTEWDLTPTSNDRVLYWIDFLKGRNYDKTRLWLEREGKYGELIRTRLRERGMPEDLLYLVMIESGLSPKAYSHAHAAGLWQFISETGRRYGLEVSPYVDERRDPLAATDAALDYLTDLYGRFGSWYLAAAGYNSGENRVERILRQRVGGQKGSDGLFWMIDEHLPRETRDYVPLMLAAAYIGKEPAKYGFDGLELQEPLAFEQVEVPGGVSLRTVAKAGSLDAGAVEDLNPHLLRGITPPGRSWKVRIPVGASTAVAANLEKVAEEDRLATVEHRVRKGETLSHIARRFGVSVSAIQVANPGLDPRRIGVGQRVHVPALGSQAARAAASVAAASATPSWTTYRVRRGDTLWGIARHHGVTVNQIRSWNGVRSRIYPGQTLRLES